MARRFRWAALLFVCTFLTLSYMAPAHATGDGKKFTGWWELGGYYGTDDASRGEAVLFTPLMQSATTIFFLDARGKLFEDDVQEGNIALGYRQMMSSGWNLGFWGGWDIRDTTNDNTFNQISFGLEALSERYDLRVNGYVPLEDSETVTNTNSFEALLQGNNIFVQQTNTLIRELAFYGVDAEFGVLLFGGNRGGGGGLKGAPAPLKRHELRAYAGGFWFDHEDADDAIAGPKGRLEYRINNVVSGLPGSRLTLESELSYDEVRDTKFEIGARLRIPFGSRGSDAASRTAALTGQELRMIEGLERDTDIVTDEQTDTTITTEGAIDDATDVLLNAVSFAQSASAFKKAVNAGGNRLIILRKGDQRIDVSSTEGQQLQDNQTVQGGASTILIRGKNSGQVVPFTAPGKRPTVFTDDGNINTGAITLANNAHVAGLNIRGVGGINTFAAGNIGIVGPNGVRNAVIEQSDIRNMGEFGIGFQFEASKIRISDTRIADVGDDGIRFVSDNTDVMINDVRLDDIGSRGISFNASNSSVSIWNAEFNNTYDEAISFNNDNVNIDIADVFVNQVPNDHGILFSNDNRGVSLRNVRIADADQRGIYIGSNNSDFTFKDIVVKRNGTGNAIEFDDNNSDFFFDGILIENSDQDGIDFESDNENVTFRNVKIIDAGRDGIEFLSNNRNIKIVNTKIINPAQEGIDFSSDNENVLIEDTVIRGGAQGMTDGIEITTNNTVSIRNVEISDAQQIGIEILAGNTIDINGAKVTNAGIHGLEIDFTSNVVTMNDTAFRDTFGNDVMHIDNANTQTLAGDGNTFIGTFGNQFCNSGAQNGSFGFDVGPQATCP